MSCTSPFTYVYNIGTEEYPYTFSGSQSVTVPGYTIPPVGVQKLVWNPSHYIWGSCQTCTGCAKGGGCTWHGCQPIWWDPNCICTTNNHCAVGWQHGSSSWCCPWNTPAIPLFPNLTANLDFSLDMTLTAGVNFVFNYNGPNAVAVAGAIINDATLGISVDAGSSQLVNLTFDSAELGLSDVELEVMSTGSFEVVVPLTTLTNKKDTGGYTYEITLGSNLLICLPPEPSVINIQFTLNYTITQNSNGNQITSQTLAVAIPLIPPGE